MSECLKNKERLGNGSHKANIRSLECLFRTSLYLIHIPLKWTTNNGIQMLSPDVCFLINHKLTINPIFLSSLDIGLAYTFLI